jgi:AIPR protein
MMPALDDPYRDYPVWTAFRQRTDLQKYDRNALLLFALELALDIEDIDSVANSALTDSGDDKKCDLVYVNEDLQTAIVAQAYISEAWKPCANANKASDLNTGASWLLSRQIEELPESLKPAARDLRNALATGKIDRLVFWYVHNCPEHANVADELKTVELTASAALRILGLTSIQVEAMEVGINKLQELFNAASVDILVHDRFDLDVPGGYRVDTKNWQAFTTAVPAKWLFEVFAKNQDKLFSANVRGYLGSRKSDANINQNIKVSATQNGSNFWAYNNGITALVHTCEFKEAELGGQKGTLTISGLSIVNGAQTTGAIGSLTAPPGDETFVPARFICCTDSEIVKEIIRFNNTQNKVEPADFRSFDKHQERLRKEFEAFGDYNYRGGRRGGASDKMKRPSNLLPSDTVAQLLAGFHKDPQLAYHEKSVIWESDDWYSKCFNDSTTAEHVIFLFSLNEAIKSAKTGFIKKQELISGSDKKALEFLRHRGCIFLLVAAFGRTMETILGRPVPNLFALKFKKTAPILNLIEQWAPVVSIYLSLSDFLLPAVKDGLRQRPIIEDSLKQFSALLAATALANKAIYEQFASSVQS